MTNEEMLKVIQAEIDGEGIEIFELLSNSWVKKDSFCEWLSHRSYRIKSNPRDFYFNEYANGDRGGLYLSKEAAKGNLNNLRNSDRLAKVIHVREVLNDE